jgi:hypothetical protein
MPSNGSPLQRVTAATQELGEARAAMDDPHDLVASPGTGGGCGTHLIEPTQTVSAMTPAFWDGPSRPTT